MVTIRRIYVLLVAAISLQALTWAFIALVRDILPLGAPAPAGTLAFEIAIVVVALPFFLVHWLWAQRLAARDEDERGNILRRFYMYGMLSIFLFAFIAQVLDLFTALLRLALGAPASPFLISLPTPAKAIADAIVGILILAIVWLYHQWIVFQDARALPETGESAAIHRVYLFGFSAVGLTMFAVGAIQLLRWVLFQVGTRLVVGGLDSITMADEIARLLVGLPLWLVFWLQAQIRFNGPDDAEHASSLRKVYLYLVVLVTVLGSVAGATFILAELLRQALGLSADGDLRNPISVLIVTAAVWTYHYLVLRADTSRDDDASRVAGAPRQTGERRLYLYLVAGVGLAAFLGGLIGIGQVLIHAALGDLFGSGLFEQLAWATAALVAGLPVWLIPWRLVQREAVESGSAGGAERQSIVRKIYLYFYLFVASITFLSSAIFILSRLLSLALGGGDSGNLVDDLANAIGFGLIAVCVWVYHGMALRGDGSIGQREMNERLAATSVVVVNGAEENWGQSLSDALKRQWPSLTVQSIGLTPTGGMLVAPEQKSILSQLGAASVIVAPWTIAAASSAVPSELVRAVSASPARKLLGPSSVEGWEWCGVERMGDEAVVREAVRAVKQILEGEDRRSARSAVVMTILVIIGICVLLQIVLVLISLGVSRFAD